MKKIARGFTLIELMVVIVIFAILMGLAVLNLGRFTPGMKYADAQERVLGAMRTGRLRAITKETTARVRFFELPVGVVDTYQIQVLDPRQSVATWMREGGGSLPEGVKLDLPGDSATFVFRADGTVRLSYTPPGEVVRLYSTKRAHFQGNLQVIPASGLATF